MRLVKPNIGVLELASIYVTIQRTGLLLPFGLALSSPPVFSVWHERALVWHNVRTVCVH